MDQYWLTIIIVVLLIAGIIFDGVRRMRKARYDSLQMKLKPTKNKKEIEEDNEDNEKGYGSEFPNGGARVSNRSIDPERIKEVRNKYNFGSDMSAWREKVVEKIAEHTSKLHSQDDEQSMADRIEPSFEADPLLDDISHSEDKTYGEETSQSSAQASVQESAVEYDSYNKSDDSDTIDQDIESAEPIEKEVTIKPAQTPVQVSLNLDESVPMLMDTFDENDSQNDKSEVEEKAAQKNKKAEKANLKSSSFDEPITKKSLNPFAKPSSVSSAHADSGTDSTSAKKEPIIGSSDTSTKPKVSMPEEVLVIHVRASQDNIFYGSDLLELILAHGLRFGAMDIFHRHAGEDGEGPILFSLSNMVKPGVFDLHTFEELNTVGVSLFLALPVETGSYMEAFDAMVDTAKDIANKLQGELKDENRSVLTGQTIEHYRERIRDFSRREQLEKHKL